MKKLLMCALVLCLLVVPCRAAEAWYAGAIDLDALADAASAAGQDREVTESGDTGALKSLIAPAEDALHDCLKGTVRSAVLMLAVAVLCSIASETSAALGTGKLSAADLAGVLGISAVALGDSSSLAALGRTTIDQIASFSDVLLPALTAATAATGTVTGAAVRETAALFFSDVLIRIIDTLLLPGVNLYLGVQIAAAAVQNQGLRQLGQFLKWAITLCLSAVLMAYLGYLAVTGAVAGSADAAAVRAAKFAISTAVPVVGGILSDAAETMLAGAGVLRAAVGVFGMLVILGVCLAPLIRLGVSYVAYKLTAVLAALISDPRLSGLIDAVGSAFALIMGMTAVCALMMLVCVISAVSAVSGG